MQAIKRGILHVIDRESGRLVCSDELLDFKEYAVKQYIDAALDQIDKTELKKAEGVQNLELSGLVELYKGEGLINMSHEMAQWVFEGLAISEDAPSGDVLVFEFEDDKEVQKIGFIKFNYKPNFSHAFVTEDNKMKANIVINKTNYPSKSKVIEEMLLINLKTLELEIVEKQYKFEGEKRLFLSEHLLQLDTELTPTNEIKLIKNIVKNISTKYNEELYVSMSRTQQALFMSIEEDGEINSERISDYVFKDNESAKNEFHEYLDASKFKGELISKNVEKYENKLSKQKFKLMNGIELNIPGVIFENSEMVEFINNPDGTINILIKNLDHIESKF
ncbi:nucleoid-associated protein [Vagococcus carniphilus]|uniref:nucleoid-associated protein n=1 Tax=Vagococcus carniphilus TaxID=218144 RepID=UPI00288E8288|nr:nucleoid-associated protein [Vagococcus carniphilus]MDT2848775.1 nucleoid-associated protein [Vagococcus carniphilus]